MKLKQTIALIETSGLDFYYYRMPLAKFLIKKGFEVYAIIPEDDDLDLLRDSNIKTLSYPLVRNRLNFVGLYKSVSQLIRYNKIYNFSIVHSFRLQPNVVSVLAFGLNKNTKIINHITGLGYSFTNSSFRALYYRLITYFMYQLIFLRTNRIITQNVNDRTVLSKLPGVAKKILIIQGSGIDPNVFSIKKLDQEVIVNLKNEYDIQAEDVIITFVGRLLKEKGIREFIEAAKTISQKYKHVKFFIIGWLDKGNPSCLNEVEIEEITHSENIFYLGKRIDIKEILSISSIFALPTYREGFPRSTLEAMSLELPVITTDVPGAKETVIDNYNGIIIKPRDTEGLVKAMECLINSPEKRHEMGKLGRQMVKKSFSADVIFNKILNVYNELLSVPGK